MSNRADTFALLILPQMTKTSLQFKDVLLLLEFLEHVNGHHCDVDVEAITVTCEFSEADLELAFNGYEATIINKLKPAV